MKKGLVIRGRAMQLLAMLDRGDDYICSVPGCGVTEDLSIDHIKPLSRGGPDEIENLQFMCKPHNSQKRDKV